MPFSPVFSPSILRSFRCVVLFSTSVAGTVPTWFNGGAGEDDVGGEDGRWP